jgi:hypothetical protein
MPGSYSGSAFLGGPELAVECGERARERALDSTWQQDAVEESRNRARISASSPCS